MACRLHTLQDIWILRPVWLTALVVFGLLPVAILINTKEGNCAYVVLVMAVLWLTETLPIPATSLLPVFMFPLTGVMSVKEVSKNYITDTSMLFLGGLILAVAVEEWNLHKRIALGVLRFFGANPMWLMLGLMLPTWFLSMWLSNTATASMMIPIVSAVICQLRDTQESKPSQTAMEHDNLCFEVDEAVKSPIDELPKTAFQGTGRDLLELKSPNGHVVNQSSGDPPDEKSQSDYKLSIAEVPLEACERSKESPEFQRLCKGLFISIAYASSIGGVATLTGTPPNLVLQGQADLVFAKYGMESGITYASWMVLGVPLAVVLLILAWLWLLIVFVRGGCIEKNKMKAARVEKAIQDEYAAMGNISLPEIILVVLFVILVIVWLSRDPKFAPGWSTWFRPGFVSDSSAAILVSVLLFILPARQPQVFGWRAEGATSAPKYQAMLTWEMLQRRLPWGVIVLLGGGFALADACQVSGLSAWVGGGLAAFGELQPWVLNLVICCIVAAATEVTSNAATAALLLPIMAEVALKTGLNPLYLMCSVALATSFAFMLPIATPPNAIVFSYGYIRIPDMAMAGLGMNVISVACLTLAVNTWGDAYFGFNTLPPAFVNGSRT